MTYQVYYESVSVKNIPTAWRDGIPVRYKYGVKVTYLQPIEKYRSLKKAQLRAEELSCMRDLDTYKYTNVKIVLMNKGVCEGTIPYKNHKKVSKRTSHRKKLVNVC